MTKTFQWSVICQSICDNSQPVPFSVGHSPKAGAVMSNMNHQTVSHWQEKKYNKKYLKHGEIAQPWSQWIQDKQHPVSWYRIYGWKHRGCNMEHLKLWPDVTLFIGSDITWYSLSYPDCEQCLWKVIFTWHFCLPYLSALLSWHNHHCHHQGKRAFTDGCCDWNVAQTFKEDD